MTITAFPRPFEEAGGESNMLICMAFMVCDRVQCVCVHVCVCVCDAVHI